MLTNRIIQDLQTKLIRHVAATILRDHFSAECEGLKIELIEQRQEILDELNEFTVRKRTAAFEKCVSDELGRRAHELGKGKSPDRCRRSAADVKGH